MSRKLYVLIRHERAQPARRGKAWRSVLRLAGPRQPRRSAATWRGGRRARSAMVRCSPWMAAWLTVSVVALVREALPFHLPAAFYEFRALERSGAVYERLGVRLFKRVVRRRRLSVFGPTLRFPQQPSVPALEQVDAEMQGAEAGHIIALLRCAPPRWRRGRKNTWAVGLT